MTNVPNLHRLGELCELVGLPVPTQVDGMSSGGRAGVVSFADRTPLLANTVIPTPFRCAFRAGLVKKLAPNAPWVVDEIHPLEAGLALTTTPKGAPPDSNVETAARAVLAALECLADLEVATFGYRVGTSLFLPTTVSWSAAVLAKANFFREEAAANGIPAALTADLIRCIEHRRADLDQCLDFGLVHGGLFPRRIRVDEGGNLVQIIDWSRAHFGDPIEDWVHITLGPKELLFALQSDLLKSVPDTSSWHRLEAYMAVRLLEILARPHSLVQSTLSILSVEHFASFLKAGALDSFLDQRQRQSPNQPDITLLMEDLFRALPRVPPERIDAVTGLVALGCLTVSCESTEVQQRLSHLFQSLHARFVRLVQLNPNSLYERPTTWEELIAFLPPPTEVRSHFAHCLVWLMHVFQEQTEKTYPELYSRIATAVHGLNELDRQCNASPEPAVKKDKHAQDVCNGITLLPICEALFQSKGRKEIHHRTKAALDKLGVGELRLQNYDMRVAPALEALVRSPRWNANVVGAMPRLLALQEYAKNHPPEMPADLLLSWMGLAG